MDAISELAERAQWLVWLLEPPRPGSDKPVKMPYSARTGRHASTTNPETWATFDEAADAAPRYSGVGYVFAFSDPYTGIDLDDCIDADGQIAEWAQAIVTRLDSYTELSPSRRGLHVFVRAALPAGRRREGPIEMYDCGRYFTMTAAPLPGTREMIAERQREIVALHAELFGAADLAVQPKPKPTRQHIEPADSDLLDRMFNSVRGSQIRRLWDGDVSRHDNDDNRADLALVAHLLFWTGGDQGRADRLFRLSALYRDKWDEKRGERTYGERTLATCDHRQPVVRGAIAV